MLLTVLFGIGQNINVATLYVMTETTLSCTGPPIDYGEKVKGT